MARSQMKKPNRDNSMADAIRRSDEAWLSDGGLQRPHTKIGVGSAKRLYDRHPDRADELTAYIKSAPQKMPVSDYDAQRGPAKKNKRGGQGKKKNRVWVREVQGGSPGLGKRH